MIKEILDKYENMREMEKFLLVKHNVTLKTIPKRYVASVRQVIPVYNQEGLLWEIMYHELEPQKVQQAVPYHASRSRKVACIILGRVPSSDTGENQVCVRKGTAFRVIPRCPRAVRNSAVSMAAT